MNSRAHAGGWAVWRSYRHGDGLHWVWSAYGPRGGTQGTAQNEDEAMQLAQRAAQDLCEPRKVEA